ncbi:glycerol acyltransferase [Mucilaginibacter robiniae]|uniref:Glycerol acyltransferase n=1 Tax=Mucilaginibacter robiniae TaxID=2728022 RepID=A0A7L5E3U7_9SPHI|nr:lysophospholipid acyltransferase family protein [Mucilaginibacter robiniae]QJD97077.1 glycerol acyltransferase [Mucilaginibacter robiniae]
MITARRHNLFSNWFAKYMRYRMNKAFKRIVVTPFEPREGHSVLLLGNHFSWWDGFFANYVAYWHLKRKLYIMIQEDQLAKRKIFTWFGGFSIEKGSRNMLKSLQYAADLLDNSENLVMIYPQGTLFSNHVPELNIEKGLERLIKYVKGPCQIVYSCVLIDYFESLKPSAYIHLFDCGVVGEIPFSELAEKVNRFHQEALKKQAES